MRWGKIVLFQNHVTGPYKANGERGSGEYINVNCEPLNKVISGFAS